MAEEGRPTERPAHAAPPSGPVGETARHTGTVLWFSTVRGWGMIALGVTGYAIWQFFWLYREPERPAGRDGRE